MNWGVYKIILSQMKKLKLFKIARNSEKIGGTRRVVKMKKIKVV